MNQMPITCPHCGSAFKIKFVVPPKSVACPNCNKSVAVSHVRHEGTRAPSDVAGVNVLPTNGSERRGLRINTTAIVPESRETKIVAKCICGKVFKLGLHLSGKRYQCPVCNAWIDVPDTDNEATLSSSHIPTRFDAHFAVGCPLCFSEITVGELKSEESEWCPVYRKIFTVPAKDEIERLRKAAPPYRLSVIKDHKEVRVLNGIAKIRSAMADGSLSPNDLAVLGPFCPALPVRGIANGINALKKLYNPIDVFADFWSWGLVAVIPAVVLTVIGGNPALGLWWFSYLIVALLVIGGGVLITLIWSRQLVGYIVFGVLTLVTAGLAIPVGLGLLVGALVNVLILKLLHTIMRPLARLIGCLSGIERNRISNWAEWMKPVQ